MTKLKINYRDPKSLTPYENNPRENDNAVPYLMNSIEEYGFLNPIIVDRNDVIVAGHTRVKAALELGLKEVPVIRAEDLSKEQADAFRLIDNAVAEKSYWDVDALQEEMAKLDLNWEDFGLEPFDIPDDMPVIWDSGEAEPVKEAEGDALPMGEYTESSDTVRLMVFVPEGVDLSGVRTYLENEGCRVKQLD